MVTNIVVKRLDSVSSLIAGEPLYSAPYSKRTTFKKTHQTLKEVVKSQKKALEKEIALKAIAVEFMDVWLNSLGSFLFEALKDQPLDIKQLEIIFYIKEEKKPFFDAFIGSLLKKKEALTLMDIFQDMDCLLEIMPFTNLYKSSQDI